MNALTKAVQANFSAGLAEAMKVDGSVYIERRELAERAVFKNVAEAEKSKTRAILDRAFQQGLSITVQPGVKFYHAQWMDRNNSPLRYKIEKIEGGSVFYKPTKGGGTMFTNVGDFPKRVSVMT